METLDGYRKLGKRLLADMARECMDSRRSEQTRIQDIRDYIWSPAAVIVKLSVGINLSEQLSRLMSLVGEHPHVSTSRAKEGAESR